MPPSSQRPWYLWPNLLSLDAPVIALIWCALLTETQQIALLPAAYLCLFGAVWVIYVVDRLMDALVAAADGEKRGTPTARHAFYRHWGRFFVLPVVVVSALCLWAAGWWLPSGLVQVGLALLTLVGVYLLKALGTRWHLASVLSTALFAGLLAVLTLRSNLPQTTQWVYLGLLLALVILRACQKPSANSSRGLLLLPKEFACGLLFALGTFLPVQFYLPGGALSVLNPVTYLFGILCGLNCLAIACYERKEDAAHDRSALPQRLPLILQVYPFLVGTLLALTTGLFLYGVRPQWEPILFAIAASAALLLILHFFSKRLSANLLRVLTDAALLTPIFFLVG